MGFCETSVWRDRILSLALVGESIYEGLGSTRGCALERATYINTTVIILAVNNESGG